ncbi:MAG: HAMP domain-containing histidine kinase [Lachnospiraceae bacterium]|nr:HAMP domain-containing histidine kinase [Lachnospiraceae bacterium]
MNKITSSLMQDRQFRRYFTFLLSFCLLLFIITILFAHTLTNSAKSMLLSHDEAIASSLIKQGVSENVIAQALTGNNDAHTQEGADFLMKIGLHPTLETKFLPHLHHFHRRILASSCAVILPVCLLLIVASLLFMHRREQLYLRACTVIENYISNDYTYRLPQTDEGAVYQMFSSVDRLATMLQAHNEVQQQSKIFLRNTISDISHQLKTPLAALSMYQEIMENEPDQTAVIQKFAAKTGLALRRMEQLIGSMLKITRLDAGNIVFDKQSCRLCELISQAISELTTRAASEHKTIVLDGSADDMLLCDPAWTGEAIGNIVKNALDHTNLGGTIRILWDSSPLTTRIQISDDGEGIAPEDIHHIFKRFYRSSKSSDMPGIGLGLPLAKSIVEGQSGTISVQSSPHMGTTFTLLFP